MPQRRSRRYLLRGFGALGGALGVRAAAVRAAESFTMRMNLVGAANSTLGVVALGLASAVRRRTNGRLTIEVYPSLQLANEPGTMDGLSSGTIDLAIQGTSYMASLFPRFAVLDLPFLFKDTPSAYRVLDGSVGRDLFADTEAKGISILGWASGGSKELETTSKSIAAPEDLKGLRIRIQPGAIYVALYQALGAIPVVIDFSETYTALAQRVVDGMDIPLNFMVTGKYYNVCKRVAMLNHVLSIIPIMASKQKLAALPAGLQKVLREEALAAQGVWRELAAKQLDDDIAFLRRNGVTLNDRLQLAPFRKAVAPVYATYQSKLGDLIDRIARAG